LWDSDGNEYLDFLAGISVLNVGHCHPHVVDAVREQVGLEQGVALPVWHALTSGRAHDLQELAEQVGAGTARFGLPADPEPARAAARAADRAPSTLTRHSVAGSGGQSLLTPATW
jgi:acetylornithine/succinyldiaminopimelate/putrescine aminotransferase